MSSNTSTSNTTRSDPDGDDLVAGIKIHFICMGVYCVIGGFLNGWLITGILKTPEVRASFRNQLIVNISLAATLDVFLEVVPFTVYGAYILSGEVNVYWTLCNAWGAYTVVGIITTFINSWLIVVLTLTFLAKVLDFDPLSKLSPEWEKTAKVAIHVFFWIIGVMIAPYLSFALKHRYGLCLIPKRSKVYISEIICSLIPTATSLVIYLIAVGFKLKAGTSGSGNSADAGTTERLRSSLEAENALTYGLVVIIAVATEIAHAVFRFNNAFGGPYVKRYKLEFAAGTASSSRIILMVVPWLFLPDIRRLLKTWRPWHKSTPGIDLPAWPKAEDASRD